MVVDKGKYSWVRIVMVEEKVEKKFVVEAWFSFEDVGYSFINVEESDDGNGLVKQVLPEVMYLPTNSLREAFDLIYRLAQVNALIRAIIHIYNIINGAVVNKEKLEVSV